MSVTAGTELVYKNGEKLERVEFQAWISTAEHVKAIIKFEDGSFRSVSLGTIRENESESGKPYSLA